MSEQATELATAEPSVRTLYAIAADIGDAGLNIADLSEEINGDGSNAVNIARQVKAEIEFIFELIEELEERGGS